MLPLYIFALLIHTAFSSIPCLDGVEMMSKETKHPADLTGNWTFVYHWDAERQFTQDFPFKFEEFTDCAGIQLDVATPEFVEGKKSQCKNLSTPFKWSDVKIRISPRSMGFKEGVIAFGEDATWFMADCERIVQIVAKKVSDDYIVMLDPYKPNCTELLARYIPTVEELGCIAHNLDVGKRLKGVPTCYKE